MYYDKLSDLGIKLTRRNGSEKTKCPKCSDGRKNKHDKPLSVNITTGEYNCHNCGYKGNVRSDFNKKKEYKIYQRPDKSLLKQIFRKEKAEKWFEQRGISKQTLEKFMIFTKDEFMPQTAKIESCICFPYFRDGEMINIKYRDGAKNFKLTKDAELIFYNLSDIGEKKHVIITEGEIDCMSAYEAGFGKTIDLETGEAITDQEHPLAKWAVVSVPNGASKGSQRLEYLDSCSDWFEGLHEIVIATDNDEAGRLLKDELIRRLGVERCRIFEYPSENIVPANNSNLRPCKDINEVLVHFGKEKVIECLNSSEMIPVDGIYYLSDIFESMLENFRKGIVLAPTTRFKAVDDFFRWKKGDINLFTGYGNHGKTTFVIQLMLIKSIYDGWKWAIFSPENYPANDFYDDIVEMFVGKWLSNMTEKEYVDACYFIDQHIFYVYPEDEHDLNSIHEKFRHLVLKKGIDGVLIDPFNQLDRDNSFQRDDQHLSVVLKDMKRFALTNSLAYNVISHPVKPQRNQDKSLPVVDMYDIAGGAMWGNKCDQIISYYRPNFHIDKNSPEVQIHIQKLKRKRTGGQLGCFDLILLWSKKRYADPITNETPCDPELAKKIIESESVINKAFGDNEFSQEEINF